ncbi:Glycosyl hydrolase 5 family protein [Fulvia fulva]|uniref:Glycosyl hydrolase 5 family protein n=1 Tax=Passalora fulva TaxID=5499 RepID=A0A9Q8LD05_PASFU|nr:Glycosyl hydrolase 5 family protein [Fulvia fulva]KAK4629373.1 Glycosyl hydrolase 5 family protein [Fulvia fulva]KAK4629801.1 Glycosyl hydrolase 5 family protein [Fulvia fulva]UJO14964.1 Glycosyl hydrolase 5 family protein [Fulvia fulva]WPV12102.1 Glycosyl hydrolase 5 family protein [Fulvia fulva]WPV26961.1 Glycosyl hydrolase 5 family protein [Fulvia fulva]
MMRGLLTASLAFAGLVSALPSPAQQRRQDGWPFAPFTTSGRDIKNSQGDTVTYAGVNWPGAADAMLPEGLQYSSIADIVSKIKSLGMNSIRLTYAIEMIDDIYSNNPNSSLEGTLVNALGQQNGTKVLDQILQNNPDLTATTTRLEVFDAVAAECYKQQILIHLDNHMSKAAWCCSADDGNAWFGDTYFNTENWGRGVAYMAEHGKNWPAFVSTGLRNELRLPAEGSPARASYGWNDWYPNIVAAANASNAANADALVFISGLNYDTDLANVTRGLDLGGGQVYDIDSFTYADKIVFELHNYNNNLGDSNCANFNMYNQGYNAMDTSANTTAKNIAPVVLTEFGFPQDNSTYTWPYPKCLAEYLTTLPGGPGGWFQWVISGSYYIRTGTQDFEETWGLLNHDWSAWRSDAAINGFTKPFVAATLA